MQDTVFITERESEREIKVYKGLSLSCDYPSTSNITITSAKDPHIVEDLFGLLDKIIRSRYILCV